MCWSQTRKGPGFRVESQCKRKKQLKGKRYRTRERMRSTSGALSSATKMWCGNMSLRCTTLNMTNTNIFLAKFWQIKLKNFVERHTEATWPTCYILSKTKNSWSASADRRICVVQLRLQCAWMFQIRWRHKLQRSTLMDTKLTGVTTNVAWSEFSSNQCRSTCGQLMAASQLPNGAGRNEVHQAIWTLFACQAHTVEQIYLDGQMQTRYGVNICCPFKHQIQIHSRSWIMLIMFLRVNECYRTRELISSHLFYEVLLSRRAISTSSLLWRCKKLSFWKFSPRTEGTFTLCCGNL